MWPMTNHAVCVSAAVTLCALSSYTVPAVHTRSGSKLLCKLAREQTRCLLIPAVRKGSVITTDR